MALDPTAMAGDIEAAFVSVMGTPEDSAKLQQVCLAIATGVVVAIKRDAVVTATGADPQGGTVASTGTVG
jgi:hypothetical protein